MNDQQKDDLKAYVQTISINDQCYYSASLTIDFVVGRLKIYDWYTQNDAFRIINTDKFCKTLSECNVEQRVLLGRNILQAADGSANEAIAFIYNFTTNYSKYGVDIARGLVYECFFNEKNQLRQKTRRFSDIESIMQNIPAADSSAILNELLQQIPQCTLKYTTDTFSVSSSSPFNSLIPLLP